MQHFVVVVVVVVVSSKQIDSREGSVEWRRRRRRPPFFFYYFGTIRVPHPFISSQEAIVRKYGLHNRAEGMTMNE